VRFVCILLAALGFLLGPMAATSSAADVTLPARGCFYYPWFPETWTVNGQHVSGDDSPQPDDGFHPTLGFYNSSDPAVIDAHATQLKWAKCEVPILSWWGPNSHSEEVRIPLFLNRTWNVSWGYLKPTVYYECESVGTGSCAGKGPNPTVAQIQADLAYLSTYANHSRWARVNNKPVIFVYSSGDSACEVASRWKAAATGWYVSLKLSSGFASCPVQPDAWHQYGPASAYHRHAGYYVNISPGFWRADEVAPRLARDLTRFKQNIRDMVASGEPWQLVTSFDEWGEGTAVESAAEWDTDPTFGDYIGALSSDGAGP
jgi:glycosyl hydrolase family 99